MSLSRSHGWELFRTLVPLLCLHNKGWYGQTFPRVLREGDEIQRRLLTQELVGAWSVDVYK